jgi:hypothetical protein
MSKNRYERWWTTLIGMNPELQDFSYVGFGTDIQRPGRRGTGKGSTRTDGDKQQGARPVIKGGNTTQKLRTNPTQ